MRTFARPCGFALVSAIFILVVLAVLGAAIVNVTSSQAIGSAQDVQGVRAYAAARAGIEWGLYKVQSTTAIPASNGYRFGYDSTNANNRACPASPTSFVPGATTLATFTVTVTCIATTDPSGGPTVYSITSTACNQPLAGACPNISPGAQYVERRLSASI